MLAVRGDTLDAGKVAIVGNVLWAGSGKLFVAHVAGGPNSGIGILLTRLAVEQHPRTARLLHLLCSMLRVIPRLQCRRKG